MADDDGLTPVGRMIDQIFELTKPVLQSFLGTDNILNIEYIWEALSGRSDDPTLMALAKQFKEQITAIEEAQEAAKAKEAERIAEEEAERKASGWPFQVASTMGPQYEWLEMRALIKYDTGTYKLDSEKFSNGLLSIAGLDLVDHVVVQNAEPKTVDTVTPYQQVTEAMREREEYKAHQLSGEKEFEAKNGVLVRNLRGHQVAVPDERPITEEFVDRTPEFIDPSQGDLSLVLQRMIDDRRVYLDLGMTTHHLWELIFNKYYALNPTNLMRRRDEIHDLFDTMINALQNGQPVDNSLFKAFLNTDLDGSENRSQSPVRDGWEGIARDPNR